MSPERHRLPLDGGGRDPDAVRGSGWGCPAEGTGERPTIERRKFPRGVGAILLMSNKRLEGTHGR
jgi:hypothetical protein